MGMIHCHHSHQHHGQLNQAPQTILPKAKVIFDPNVHFVSAKKFIVINKPKTAYPLGFVQTIKIDQKQSTIMMRRASIQIFGIKLGKLQPDSSPSS